MPMARWSERVWRRQAAAALVEDPLDAFMAAQIAPEVAAKEREEQERRAEERRRRAQDRAVRARAAAPILCRGGHCTWPAAAGCVWRREPGRSCGTHGL